MMKKGLYITLLSLCCMMSCKEDITLEEELKQEEEKQQKGDTITTPAIDTGIYDYVGSRRMLWASLSGDSRASQDGYEKHNNRILVSWRSLPTDSANTSFDLYWVKNGKESKINWKPLKTTCYVDTLSILTGAITYRLKKGGTDEVLDTYTLSANRVVSGLPFISIPLHPTLDINQTFSYGANDASIGDLDGDGVYEIVQKRVIRQYINGASYSGAICDMQTDHYVLLEAYKLDGTFMWRVCLGPNILIGNISSFAVYDFDGDGRAEVATRTSEGTVFGDGTTIGDTNGDNKIDYRDTNRGDNIGEAPEFLSVIDGTTGRELARTNYIPCGTSEEWGDNYYHRSSSFRIGVARCDKERSSIIIGRGCYAKIVVEAWDYNAGSLTRRWNFDTTADGGKYKDYEAMGFHNMRSGDVDGDGRDEIVYGSCTIDHDGSGLNCCGLGHGDALHLGKFDTSRDGLQIWSCYEYGDDGITKAALRDAKTGEVIWRFKGTGDEGRAMVADIDADSPGCEMWSISSPVFSQSGEDLGYTVKQCNMCIWFSGSLNRQMLNNTTINAPKTDKGCVFSANMYDAVSINGSKANPCWYGDIVGDWREEVIFPNAAHTEIRLYSTWFPTDYTFHTLMSDHTYAMSAVNQNIGYNQPNHLGYYLGSDLYKK